MRNVGIYAQRHRSEYYLAPQSVNIDTIGHGLALTIDTNIDTYFYSIDIDMVRTPAATLSYICNWAGEIRALITSVGDLRVYASNGFFTVSNFYANYSGIGFFEFKVIYNPSGTFAYVDNVLIGSDATKFVVATQVSPTDFWIGSNGVVALAQLNVKTFNLNGETWGINEGNGFQSLSNLGGILQGTTSNAGGLTYWNSTVWTLIP